MSDDEKWLDECDRRLCYAIEINDRWEIEHAEEECEEARRQFAKYSCTSVPPQLRAQAMTSQELRRAHRLPLRQAASGQHQPERTNE